MSDVSAFLRVHVSHLLCIIFEKKPNCFGISLGGNFTFAQWGRKHLKISFLETVTTVFKTRNRYLCAKVHIFKWFIASLKIFLKSHQKHKFFFSQFRNCKKFSFVYVFQVYWRNNNWYQELFLHQFLIISASLSGLSLHDMLYP